MKKIFAHFFTVLFLFIFTGEAFTFTHNVGGLRAGAHRSHICVTQEEKEQLDSVSRLPSINHVIFSRLPSMPHIASVENLFSFFFHDDVFKTGPPL